MTGPAPEFHRPVSVRSLGRTPVGKEVAADAGERAAVAARLDVVAIARLEAHATLQRRDDGAVVVHGRVEADLTRESIVSLEPFETSAAEEFATVFVPETGRGEREVEIDPTEVEDVEVLEGGSIDIGELAVQYLSLALDPYPRAPGEALPPEEGDHADGQDDDA